MDIQKEREAFENHLKKMGKTDNETFSKNEDDSYQMDIIHFGWKIWQAAKAHANKQFENFIDQAIEDSACADERRSLQALLDEFQDIAMIEAQEPADD